MSKASPWIHGIHAVAAAIQHDPAHVREVLVEAGSRNLRLHELEQQAREAGIEIRRVTTQSLEGIAAGARHQGVAARYLPPPPADEQALPALIEAARGHVLLLVLDGVQDPHNLGACLRSAAAAGATAVLVPRDKSAQLTATVRKTAAGAADIVPVVSVANLSRALREVRELGVWVYGLDGTVPTTLYATDLRGDVALVLGGEGEGLRRLTREQCDGLARIPMPGGFESLNVSVAAGIALFEAVRQRQPATL